MARRARRGDPAESRARRRRDTDRRTASGGRAAGGRARSGPADTDRRAGLRGARPRRACADRVLEEAGYSLLGPPALNCAAPDEGNMHLLEVVGSDEQKERFLRPLARARVRSAFAMSEPPPGAGSDPSLLRTEATTGGRRLEHQRPQAVRHRRDGAPRSRSAWRAPTTSSSATAARRCSS